MSAQVISFDIALYLLSGFALVCLAAMAYAVAVLAVYHEGFGPRRAKRKPRAPRVSRRRAITN